MDIKKYKARVAFTLITQHGLDEKEALQKVERYKTECRKFMNEGHPPEKTADLIKDKRGMSREEFEEAIKGILQENRDHPMPKVISAQCNKCKHQISKSWSCKVLGKEIPDEILDNEVICPQLEEK